MYLANKTSARRPLCQKNREHVCKDYPFSFPTNDNRLKKLRIYCKSADILPASPKQKSYLTKKGGKPTISRFPPSSLFGFRDTIVVHKSAASPRSRTI